MSVATDRTERPAATSAHRVDLIAAGSLVVMWSSGFIGAGLGHPGRPRGHAAGLALRRGGGRRDDLGGVRGIRPDRRTWPRLVLVGLLCQCLYLGGVVTGVGLGVPPGTAGLAAYALVAGGMLALSTGTLLERRLRLPVSLLESLTVQTLTSMAFFLTVASIDYHLTPPAVPQFWWAVLRVVALSTFGGYGSYLVVLRRSGATRVSTLLFLTPPTTALWAFLMFGTRPGLLALPGAAVCAVAVTLVVRRGRAPRTR